MLSLLFSLSECDPSKGFPLDGVAYSYTRWFLSAPFDMGGTTSKAFKAVNYFESRK